LGANRTLAGDKEDDGNDADIENIVETEDEKQGKTDALHLSMKSRKRKVGCLRTKRG
jgi:hypothetical protein